MKGSMVMALCAMVIGGSVEAYSQPKHPPKRRPVVRHHHPHHGRVVVRHPVPHYGRVVVTLPPKHRKVVVRRHPYFFHQGVFYQPGSGGYVVVKAPIGAIVATIPYGYITFGIGNLTYFYYGGIYYRRVPTGYMVVESPPETVIIQESLEETDVTPTAGDRVSVTAQSLNVRSGPDANQSVIAQILKDTVVVVRGQAPGWLYVELPNGTFGWIMTGYTALLPLGSSG